jgi:trans-2,3-dihydro-3-hydroxyanthranilate isomerase
MKCRYYLIDAFTRERFQGAQIAVFVAAAGLDGRQMQLIARELNLSETVFIQRCSDDPSAWCFRVFSPLQELDFSGPPIIAGCYALARNGQMPVGPSSIRLPLGDIDVNLEEETSGDLRIGFSMRTPVRFDDFVPSARELADMLYLDENDLEQGEYRPMIVSSGHDYLMIPLKSPAALAKARFNEVKWTLSFVATLASQILLFAVNRSSPLVDFNVRLLGKGIGEHEDPPVGSAVPAFAAYVFSGHSEGHHRAVLQRGGGERRSSILHAEVVKSHGHMEQIIVAGHAVLVGEGELYAP